MLGRHSLRVFLWHVVLVYALRWLDTVHGPFGEAGKNGLAMLLIASLWLVPLLRERLPAALRPARRQPQS